MSDSGVVRSRSPRRGAARWREIFEYDRFIGTQAEFCRLHGITGSSLRYWRLKQETSFVEVAAPESVSAWDVELAFGDCISGEGGGELLGSQGMAYGGPAVRGAGLHPGIRRRLDQHTQLREPAQKIADRIEALIDETQVPSASLCLLTARRQNTRNFVSPASSRRCSRRGSAGHCAVNRHVGNGIVAR